MAGERFGYPLHFHRPAPQIIDDDDRVVQQLQGVLGQRLPLLSLNQLPADRQPFIGHRRKIEDAIAFLTATTRPAHPETAPRILNIAGRAGIGKSALAIHLAHLVTPHFPDAQLYINLRGFAGQPLTPEVVLAEFLRSWGIPDAAIPKQAADRATLLQAQLANKRTLITLDNAETDAQIIPLIPEGVVCAVLITSRKRFVHLEKANILDLAELSEPDAIDLLQWFSQRPITQFDREVGISTVNLCNRLPLALCLAGIALRIQPHLSLKSYTEQLAKERTRLKPLHLSHIDVRTSFSLLYQQLDATAACLLRRLGLLNETSFTVTLAAAVLDSEIDKAQQTIESLIQLNLLQSLGQERYCFAHDLIRLLGRSQLAAEDSMAARQAARLRVSHWYLDITEPMSLALDDAKRLALASAWGRQHKQSPGIAEKQMRTAALRWFEFEQPNIEQAVEWAYQAGAWKLVLRLTDALTLFLRPHQDLNLWRRLYWNALEAAQQLGDRFSEACILNNLGNLHQQQQQWERAQTDYETSLRIFSELNHIPQVAQTLTNLGTLYIQQGDIEAALLQWSAALSTLASDSPDYRDLQKRMQAIDKLIWQKAMTQVGDRATSPHFFRSIGSFLKRFILEES